jgi:serine protease Do
MRTGIVRVAIGVALVAGIFIVGLTLGRTQAWDGGPAGSRYDFDAPRKAPAPEKDPPALAAREFNQLFVSAARKAAPSVVHIEVEQKVRLGGQELNDPSGMFNDEFLRKFFGGALPRTRPAPEDRVKRGLGSGVIVDRRGYILTNHHVIGGADKIKVVLADRRDYPAKVVGTDEHSDLAVVKIDAPDLPVAVLGDSDALEVGEWVLAIGDPFGLDRTVTAGVVSAKNRTRVEDIPNEDFIQTDAAINPGNSGGPLVNLEGQVVGTNTAIFTRSGGYMGIGFAIPINMARTIMQEIIEHGKVTRGWLGVSIQDVTADMAKALKLSKPSGALVAEVVPKSPAAEAGIRERDVIVAFGGKDVGTASGLTNAVGFTPVGKEVDVQLVRDGKPMTVKVRIEGRPAKLDAAEAGSETVEKLGLSVQNATEDLRRQFGLPGKAAGVLISEVKPGSPAAEAGLAPGMLIEEVGEKSVANVGEFQAAIGAAKDGVLLTVRDRNHVAYLTLRMG